MEKSDKTEKKSRFNDDLIDYMNNGLHSLLFARAVGTFFNINGNFYCGEVRFLNLVVINMCL